MTLSLLCPEGQPELEAILYTALVRSLSRAQVKISSAPEAAGTQAWVVANAPEEWAGLIIEKLAVPGSKILLLGKIPEKLAAFMMVKVSPLPEDILQQVACAPATSHHTSESKAVIRYHNVRSHLGIDAPIRERYCRRYDFTDEWNNLGYGAIRADGSIWALAQQAQWPGEQILATLECEGEIISSYAALWQKDNASLLWVNRPAGAVDSQEWRMIERYLSSYDYPGSICLPVLREIPGGFDAAVTMRLDCDEDIASATSLFNLYQSEKIPFSLAVTTQLLEDARHMPLLRSVLASGGSLLSHSATHPVNWGGSYEEACREVTISRNALKDTLGKDTRIDYAVSPFHQNPPYAVRAMADSGLKGFIGGIIHNDPEYVLARGGIAPFAPDGFISHSQQYMLLGDCLIKGCNPLAIYKQAIDITFKNGALFGYLDHPFSPRYQYGWESEEQRSNVHRELIAYMRKYGNVLFLSQNDALDWIRYKASADIIFKDGGFYITSQLSSPWTLQAEYGGKISALKRMAA